jgi:site-specific DNA recombinase
MKSAYLYICVSTDEQKRKGYSQQKEDRPLKYCEFENIERRNLLVDIIYGH